MVIDKKSPLPRYYQLLNILEEQIYSNKLSPGEKINSERVLMTEYSLSRTTVTKALDALVDKGLLWREHGRGTFVRNRAVRKEDTIGIIVASMADGVFPKLVFAMEETAHRLGYSVLLCNSQGDFVREEEYSQRLISKKVGGIIFDPLLSSTQYERNIRCINKFIRNHIPVVIIGHLPRTESALEYDSIDMDDEQGAYELINHLIQLGHKRIGVITEPFNPDGEERVEGYKKALRENGMEFDTTMVKQVRLEVTDKRDPKVVKEFLEMKNRPTAIFAIHDVLAYFVMKVLISESVKIPEEMAVVGFDDLDFSDALAVPLTTVHGSLADQGRMAVEMVIERIKGERRNAKHVILPTKLAVRESCGVKQIMSKQPNIMEKGG